MAQQFKEWAAADRQPGGLAAWAASAPPPHDEIRRTRAWLIVMAVVALIAGAVSIAVPVITSVTMSILIGWVLLLGGVAGAVHGISDRAPLRALEALVTAAAGFYLLALPLNGTITLTLVLAIWLFASGLLSLTALSRGGGAMALLGGLLSILLGVLIAVELPSSAAWAIGLLVGVELIFWAARALAAARLLRGAEGD